MCGRYTVLYTWAEVRAFSGLALPSPAEAPEPAFNLAPTQAGWVLTAASSRQDADAEPQPMRWGLIPGWARDARIGASMINARLETCPSKPAFRAAWKSRRCLVPASGFYEWRSENGVRQPYYIRPADAPVLMFAGVWEQWRQPDGTWLHSYALITRDADESMRTLHDRAPLMLSPPVLRDWLHGSADDAAAIAAAAVTPPLTWHPVDRAVGDVRSRGPRLIEPVALPGRLL